jgi:hypothetical protein
MSIPKKGKKVDDKSLKHISTPRERKRKKNRYNKNFSLHTFCNNYIADILIILHYKYSVVY